MKEKTAFLGTQGIRKLLFSMSAPAIIGMLVIALYNVVDTIFIGQAVGTLGIAAVSVSFPLQTMFFAIALSIGVGAASEVSRNIGANKQKEAERILGVAMWLVLVGSGVLLLGGLFLLEPILRASGGNSEVMSLASEYTRVILYGAPFLVASIVGNSLVRSEGNAKLAMMVMVVGGLTNLCLDWLFLFPLNMGIAGAAWATSIAHVVSFSLLIPYFFLGKSAVPLLWKNIQWHWGSVKKIMTVGSASFMREVSFVLEMVVLNHVLISLGGSVALAAIGIMMRLAMMVLMPIFGIIQGMQPIAGYNFGARNFSRVKEVFVKALLWATGLSVVAFFLLYFASDFWVGLFTKDGSPELITMATEGLRWMVLAFAVVGGQSVIGGLYQALGFGRQSLILSLLRQVIFLVPLVLILSHFFGLQGVWWSFPLAEVATTIVVVIMVFYDREKLGLRAVS